MRVLRTVTMENSAATKSPLAHTNTRSPPRPHSTSMRGLALMLRFSVREEVRVDEVVDESLGGRIDRFELDTHTDAPIGPRDATFGIDVPLRSGHAEANLDFRAAIERARRADGDTSVAQVERQRRRDRVAEPILNRDA